MSRRGFLKKTLLVLLSFALFAQVPGAVFALDDGKMAHNIYSDPDLSGTSRKFDTFSIDFRAIQVPAVTYWALCNWSMDLTATRVKYPNAKTGGGAYAGLQHTENYTTGPWSAIMSFWDVKESDNGEVVLSAKRMYPVGKDDTFGGEGTGTNWITQYPWVANQWYRMVIHCWKDSETGTTFVGQWFQNLTTGEYRLISYFDTQLLDSYFTGGMSQFQENYSSVNADPEREFNVKNLYAFDHQSKSWKSLATSRLSRDFFNNKRGDYSFGKAADEDGEYFWGKASGILPEGVTQTEYDQKNPSSGNYTINQPATPNFGAPAVESVTLQASENGWEVSWDVGSTGTPQLSYKVELLDKQGKVVDSLSGTRPEVRACSFAATADDGILCRVTVTDPFGNSAVGQTATDSFNASLGDLNFDEKFTIEDVTLLLQELSNPSAIPKAMADANDDGLVNAKDISRLLLKLQTATQALPETNSSGDRKG